MNTPDDGAGGGEQRGLGIALQFTTEFGENATIFRTLLGAFGSVIEQVPNHETRINYLNGYLGTLRGRVGALESQVGEIEGLEAEIERLEGELASCKAEPVRDEG